MARLLILGLSLALAAPARAATLQEVEGFFAFSVGSASSCSGSGQCIGVDVAVAPGHGISDAILFDLQLAWDPSYWSLSEISGAGVVQRDDTRGFIDDLFGDVGAGAPIPTGDALFRLVFEVIGSEDPFRTVLEIGDLSARDPFFDRAVLVADSSFRTFAPTPNSMLVIPEPGSGLLLGLGLAGIGLRRRRRAALACAALAGIACSDGGRVPDQRTFLWHSGDANQSGLSPTDANPFRGRVAPAKPLRVDLGILNPDTFGAAQPAAIRFDQADLLLNPAALLSTIPAPAPGGQTAATLDALDLAMQDILLAPGQVPGAAFDVNSVYLDLRGWPASGGGTSVRALLSSTFPGRFTANALSATGLSPSPDLSDDFGGDYLGGLARCADPRSASNAAILAGTSPANPLWQCIESSSTGGGPGPGTTGQIGGTPGNPPNVDPGDPKGSYTPPGLSKMTGGTGELPFRPAPDQPSGGGRVVARTDTDALVDIGPASEDPTLARGLFIPSRGMRLGMLMHWERNVDPATGRPLVGRLDTESIGTCAAAGEYAPDPLNAAGLVYNTSFASHPFSVTPGAPQFDSLSPGFSVLRRGGVGTDPDCLRPGGAPGEADAFAFDEDILADTNALQNHHANQGVFASLCRATLPFESAIDPGACLFNLFGSRAVLQLQLLPISLVESLTSLFAGEQSGSAGPQQLLGLIATNQKGAVLGSQLSPVPLAGLDRLFNDPTAPFDGNLGGFDGFDGRVQIPGRQPTGVSTAVAPFVTLDKALTNEQRALGGCGPFYASRCDSPLLYRNTSQGLSFGGSGGLDLLNGEASALLESVRAQGASGSETSAVAQPGTVGFDGPPVCMRKLANGDLVRLPGCRGVKSLEVATNTEGLVVRVEFDAGYLPSKDGCVIGSQIRRAGASIVPVELVGGSAGDAQLAAELARCNGAIVRRVVPSRLFTDADADGNPDVDASGAPITVANPACSGASIGTGSPTQGLRVCNAATTTLEQWPLVHPIAGCVASKVHFAAFGADDCRYWMYRGPVEELLAGTAQLFRSEMAAFSWNLTMFMTVTSCGPPTDPYGNDHRNETPPPPPDYPRDCFDPTAPYDATRCSLAAPQHCKNVRALLGLAPPNPADGSLPDADGDGIPQDGDGSGAAGDRPCLSGEVLACDDNCEDAVNPRQVNSNGLGPDSDPYGNVCDPDLDNDGAVTDADRLLQLACFQSESPPPECADADLVGASLGAEPDPQAIHIDGYDRLQLLRWLRSPGSAPGAQPGP